MLSLYGMLAAGMTADTYISGEAVSLLPVNGAYDRTMFMPPNTGANASYLETLHELLVHERAGPLGAPAGLDLAFSTPRAWLADGQEIDVHDAPTSFGDVTYSLIRAGATIEGRLVLPAGAHSPPAASTTGGRASETGARRSDLGHRRPSWNDRPRQPPRGCSRPRDGHVRRLPLAARLRLAQPLVTISSREHGLRTRR